MFNAQIKLDLKELTERVDLMEQQLRNLYKEVAMLKNPSNVPEPAVVRHTPKPAVVRHTPKPAVVRHTPKLGSGHSERYLVRLPSGGIDIEASLKAINRTIYEIMEGSWLKDSAECRIDLAVRCATAGQGGLLSREAWLRANPEQLDLLR